ncbi:MAG: hypothetical protein ICV60_12915 [Pyrinomonadaceae bacterium]|nr:hypothetical protein [Pyrinomonadaceae bacterium]
MTRSLDRLYDLLPVVYRMRDAEQGYPLRALLRVINEQADIIEDDIAQLYENWFIETCEDWVVPYIGDLIGHRSVHEAGEPVAAMTAQALARNRILVPRRDVAATIGNRRRKGTLALLEMLASEVAGWPSRSVEFYKLLGWTQNVNHLRPLQGQTVDIRDGHAMDLIDTPFDTSAHTIDVRRIASHWMRGLFNLPDVGIFVWRLKAYSVTQAPARCMDDVGAHAYTISSMGHDLQLYNHPRAEDEATHIAEEVNLPVPISLRAFAETRVIDGKTHTRASADYYGLDENGAAQSLAIWAPDWPKKGAPQPIPREAIIPANLKGWRYRAPENHVLVDTERGRIIFPPYQPPKKGVRVSYYYGFSADMGGGEYPRQLSQPEMFTLYRVHKRAHDAGAKIYPTIQEAVDAWLTDKDKAQAAKLQAATDEQKAAAEKEILRLRNAVIEITDSEVYVEREALQITLKEDETLQLRASVRTRPIIRMWDYTEGMDALNVSGARGSRFTLDGITILGRGIQILKNGEERVSAYQEETVQGAYEVEEAYQKFKRDVSGEDDDLCSVIIRHCTLVPGWELHGNCEPKHTEPSLFINHTRARIRIEHSILGPISVEADQVKTEPVRVHISDSILDATSNELSAIESSTLPIAYVRLNIARTTVIGEIHAHEIELAENCIFNAKVRVARRQPGCVRFSYVAPESRTPRRYECQPDLVIAAAAEDDEQQMSEAELEEKKMHEALRVRPLFNSTRYGTPAYCQLAEDCAEEIKRGAEDESEMGAFHDLYQPQRRANIRARLDEYTPAGMEAGIIYAS